MKNKRTIWRAIGVAAIIALTGFGVTACPTTVEDYVPTVDRTAHAAFNSARVAGTLVDRAVLGAAIGVAEALLAATRESVNGSNVPTTAYWTTEQVRKPFAAAVEVAREVRDDDDATQDEIADTFAALAVAKLAFEAERRPGTRPGWQPPASRRGMVSAGGNHTMAIREDGSLTHLMERTMLLSAMP